MNFSDLNYCTHHSPCKNAGVCVNSGQGSYSCACAPGYTGTNCEQEIDDCVHIPCRNGGTCEDKGSYYKCRCPNGFTGKRCDVIAEQCACQNGATCVEGQGTYQCICKSGFTGRNCETDLYDCEPNPCQNSKLHSFCTRKTFSYTKNILILIERSSCVFLFRLRRRACADRVYMITRFKSVFLHPGFAHVLNVSSVYARFKFVFMHTRSAHAPDRLKLKIQEVQKSEGH